MGIAETALSNIQGAELSGGGVSVWGGGAVPADPGLAAVQPAEAGGDRGEGPRDCAGHMIERTSCGSRMAPAACSVLLPL